MKTDYRRQLKEYKKDFKKSHFPKKYAKFVEKCFLRDGYVLAIHRRNGLPYNPENNPLINGFPNNGGTAITNTLFVSSSSYAALNYAIPNIDNPDVLLCLIPKTCFNKENPEVLFTRTKSEQYCEDCTHYIDPTYILGYFSYKKGKYSFTSNIPMDNSLNITDSEFLNTNGLYSDNHTFPDRVLADSDSIDFIGRMNKKDDSRMLHPILSWLRSFFKPNSTPKLPSPSQSASTSIRDKYYYNPTDIAKKPPTIDKNLEKGKER